MKTQAAQTSDEKRALIEKYLQRRNPQAASASPIPRREPGAAAPLSLSQEPVWLHACFTGAPIYNDLFTIYRNGPLDCAALQASLTEIVRRHEAWRTTFRILDGEPRQTIYPVPEPIPLPAHDLTVYPEAERATEALRIATEEARRPFDLAEGPLVRMTLLRLSNEEYRLLVVAHHLIFDGDSINRVFLPELIALYDSFSAGNASPLSEPPAQYADFALWQRAELSAERIAEQTEYWAKQLAGATTLIPLPSDRPRPAVPSFRGAQPTFVLPKELAESAKALARRESVTPYTVFLSAFYTLLYRYSQQDDLMIGTITASRKRPEFEGVLGYFLNTLLLRVSLSGNPTCRELFARVAQTTAGALSHPDVPFHTVLQQLEPARKAQHFPALVFFSLEAAPPSQPSGWSMVQRDVEVDAAKFDLYLELDDRPECLVGRFTYSTDLFDAGTIVRMQGHFRTLLESILSDPGQRLTSLPLLTGAEREQAVEEWNRTEREYPAGAVHKWIEKQAERTPEAIAVSCRGRRLSYGELNRRANRLAHYLRARGVGAETRVGVCLERSVELVVGLLGILKAGGAYVPLDPGFPSARLALMVEDAALEVVVSETAVEGALPQGLARVIRLDGEAEAIARSSGENPQERVAARQLAYVIYTSGSTGQPKGVEIEHRSVVNLLRSMQREPGMKASDCLLAVTTISFDIAGLELYLPLVSGGRVEIASREAASDGRRLAALLEESGATVMQATPASWRLLLEAGWKGDPRLKILCGGEALGADLAQQLRERGASVWNLYGPTETTIWSAAWRVEEGERTPPIGRPIANTRFYVLDAHQEPTPIGVAGELYIAGDGLARGYRHRPEETAARFVAEPFGPGERMYRTGDLARYRPDGAVEFLGRADQQVKLRGFRIELGEIEAALAHQPGVQTAVAAVREDSPGDRRLVAYLVAEGGTSISSEQVRAWAKTRLPEYMVPGQVVFLESYPLTPNGKIDRKALPVPQTFSPTAAECRGPRNEIEAGLAAIWKELLKQEPVGIEDDFWELGGHSLLAARVFARIQNKFEVSLPLRQIYQTPTLAGLAEAIAAERARGGAAAERIEPRASSGPGRLSFMQERLWFLDQLEPASAAYNIPRVTRLKGRLQLAALEQALGEVVERHQILRTGFELREGIPVQVARPAGPFEIKRIDLGREAESAREERARELLRQELARPFDLAKDIVKLRATLVRLGEEEYLLMLVLHHIAADAWSLGILGAELKEFYAARVEGRQPRVAELPVQYADCAEWQRKRLSGAQLERQLSYWKHQLEGVPALLELPTDRPRPARETHRGAVLVFSLPEEVTRAVKQLSLRSGVSLYTSLLAGFQTLLYRYTGQETICVGSPITNRPQVEMERLIGPFINTLVLRGDLDGEMSFAGLLERTREVVLEAHLNQDLPFEKLVSALGLERSLAHAPLFQVMLALQNHPEEALSLAGLEAEPVEIGGVASQFDLTLYLAEQGNQIQAWAEYNTDLFDRAAIERLWGHYRTLLEAAAAAPEQALGSLPLMSGAEREQAVEEWNRTEREYPAGAVHEWIEKQAERTPEAVAVSCRGRRLSYGELNRRANRLAHYLRARGVGVETRVGVCLERSVELVVGLLGILKAGGAYVPLDPGFPSARLALMVEDAGLEVVVSETAVEGALPQGLARVIRLDGEAEAIARSSGENPEERVAARQLAYVIYTSGSTGQPKGVEIEHRSVVNLLRSMQREPGMEASDCLLAVTTISFDIAGLELYLPLVSGGRVEIASREAASDGRRLAALLEESGATVMQATPASWRLLLEAGWKGDPRLKILCGGEALGADLAQQLRERGASVWNLYGPTETTIWSAAWRVEEGERTPPIGRPIANTRFYVLDAHQEPTPIGVAGELYIAGDGLARGYRHRPEETAARFAPEPFGPGERMYRTGDLARYRPDGAVEFLGRADQQVKLRGFRIELGEIEAALAHQPGVQTAVAAVREDSLGDKFIAAYIVSDSSRTPTVEDLQSALRQKLPHYMIPSRFGFLEELPLTPNGKVNRRRLPEPKTAQAAATREFAGPRTALERNLTEIWEATLGRKPIGIRENFFDLGGHSLMGARLLYRIQQATGANLPMATLFTEPTIEQLAASIEAQGSKSRPPVPVIALQPLGSRPPFFCICFGVWPMYRPLLRQLDKDQPFFGLDLDPSIADHLSTPYTLEAVAEHLACAIREQQPQGPYYLGGYCMSGMLAYETARVLSSQGEKVGLVAMFLSYNPVPLNLFSQLTQLGLLARRLTLRRICQHIANLWRTKADSSPEYVRTRVNDFMFDLKETLWQMTLGVRCFLGGGRLRNVRAILFRAAKRYHPGPYAGPVALFRSDSDGAETWNDPLVGWGEVAEDVKLIHIPGDSVQIFDDPNAEVLAKELSVCLQNAAAAVEPEEKCLVASN